MRNNPDGVFAMSYTIQSICLCDTGKYRERNQDNFYFNGKVLPVTNNGLQRPLFSVISTDNRHLYSVFDGMGGEAYGEVAASVAAKNTVGFFKAQKKSTLDSRSLLIELAKELNEAVANAAIDRGGRLIGTTQAAVLFDGDDAWISNTGDSPVFLFRGGNLEKLSLDDTQYIPESDGVKRRKPALTQFLGLAIDQIEVTPHVKKLRLASGDRFLICSDGLTDMVPVERIGATLQEISDVCLCGKALLSAALEAGGADNTTIILCGATENSGNAFTDLKNAFRAKFNLLKGVCFYDQSQKKSDIHR